MQNEKQRPDQRPHSGAPPPQAGDGRVEQRDTRRENRQRRLLITARVESPQPFIQGDACGLYGTVKRCFQIPLGQRLAKVAQEIGNTPNPTSQDLRIRIIAHQTVIEIVAMNAETQPDQPQHYHTMNDRQATRMLRRLLRIQSALFC